MSAAGKPHRFLVLDGLRGVAAFIVVFRHFTLGPTHYALPLSFLAVDFFFVLSGFVLEPTFIGRDGGRPPVAVYLANRVGRLWPAYLLGVLLAVAGAGLELGRLPTVGLREWVGAGFILPLVGSSSIFAFPLLQPAWSLFAEFWVANLLFLLFYALISQRTLAAIVAVAGICYFSLIFAHGDADIGWTWKGMPAAVPRVLFSFGVGCLLRRLHRSGQSRLLPPGAMFLLAAALIGALSIPAAWPVPGLPVKITYPAIQVLVVLVAFPLIVHLGSQASHNQVTGTLARVSGEISYPLYVLHAGLASIAYVLLPHSQGASGCVTTYLAVLGFLPICWLVSRYYEGPITAFVKNRSAAWIGGRKTPPVPQFVLGSAVAPGGPHPSSDANRCL